MPVLDRAELTRPLTLIVAAIAVIGLIVAISLIATNVSLQTKLDDLGRTAQAAQAAASGQVAQKDAKLGELSAQLEQRSAELQAASQQLEALRQASGDLQVVTQNTENTRRDLEALQAQQAEATKTLETTRQSLAAVQA